MFDSARALSAAWIVGGMPVLGLLSYKLSSLHPILIIALAAWVLGLIPAMNKLFD